MRRTNQTRRVVPRSPRFGVVAILIVVPASSALGTDRFEADFTKGSFDERALRLSPGGAAGQWQLGAAGLQATMPAGESGRPYLSLTTKFEINGNFDVEAHYTINDLPRPARVPDDLKDWDVSNNLQLSLAHPQGLITLLYRNHRWSGEGVGFFATALDKTSKSNHRRAQGEKGRLTLRRLGSDLTFLSGAATSPLAGLGTIPYGTEPVPHMSLEVMSLNTTSPIDVTFTKLSIRADSITYDEPEARPEPSPEPEPEPQAKPQPEPQSPPQPQPEAARLTTPLVLGLLVATATLGTLGIVWWRRSPRRID